MAKVISTAMMISQLCEAHGGTLALSPFQTYFRTIFCVKLRASMPIARTFLEFLSSYSQRVSGWSESAQLENYLPDPLLPLLLLLLPKLACAPCKYNNTTTNTRKMPIQIQFQIKIQLSARPAASSTAPAAAQTCICTRKCRKNYKYKYQNK